MMMKFQSLQAIFEPHSVAVVGASQSPAKLGYHVMKSLTQGDFQGQVLPINPKETEMFGLEVFSSIPQVPHPIDLAIIVLPAKIVPHVLTECSEKGIKGVILITAGFREIEAEHGSQLQEEITQLANEAGIGIIGPNTFGALNVQTGFNGSFTPELSRLNKGGVSLVSQSGGMAHLLGFMALEANVGFSKIAGVGNRCNLDFGDLVEYLAQDPTTQVIAIYMEGTDDPRRLIDTAQTVRGKKPIVVYKVGRSPASDHASRLHTGSMAGQYQIYRGAFQQAGILAVNSSQELLDTAKALATCPLPQGNQVAVLAGQAGLGMAACDVCERTGLSLATFSAETQKRINEALPPLAIRTNPIDLGPAWYSAEASRNVVEAVLADDDVHAIILGITYASANRSAIEGLSDPLIQWGKKKPILCSFSAPQDVWGEEIRALEENNIPNYPTPESASQALANLVRYRELTRSGK